MWRQLMKSKLHRARVTHADLHYEGSITVDPVLLEAANIVPHEHVHVWNVNNGQRFETYALEGERGSGVIQVNGAAAHHAKPDDLVIITSFAHFAEDQVAQHHPQVVLLNETDNSIKEISTKSGRVALALDEAS